MTEFKSQEMQQFYYTVTNNFPGMTTVNKKQLKNMLESIELPESPQKNYETFFHDLNINGCGTIKITWNIEKLLQYEPTDQDYKYYTVRELLSLIDFDAYQTREVLSEIKLGLKSQQKKDYIVLGMLPGFPRFSIVDGNHRVLEKLNDLDYTFKCFMLADDRVLDFLEPNSKQFIQTIYWINSIIIKE